MSFYFSKKDVSGVDEPMYTIMSSSTKLLTTVHKNKFNQYLLKIDKFKYS